MVRFSCFYTHIHYHKNKKEVQETAESMNKTYQVCSEDQAMKVSGIPSGLSSLLLKACLDNPSNSSGEKVLNSPSPEHCCQSEEMHPCFSPETNVEVHRRTSLKKSQSLGSGLDRERGVNSDNETEDGTDQGFSCDESCGKNYAETFYGQNGMELSQSNDPGMNSFNQFHNHMNGVSFQESHNTSRGESIFSIGDEKHVEEEKHEDFATQLSGDHVSDFGPNTPRTTHIIEKSRSLPNVRVLLHTSEGSPSQAYIGCRSRSFEDLDALHAKRKAVLNEVGFHAMEDEKEISVWESRKIKCDNHLGDGYDLYNFSSSKRDSSLPTRNDIMDKHGRESWDQNLEELPSTEFMIKRTEDWVSRIDIGDSSLMQDTSESFQYNGKAKKIPSVCGTVATSKLDPKTNHGMEAAKNYISSLTATSTSAQLANLGLVMIPFLSAFVSLKVLNLSGNSIVRITAGALPRGLHVLNLAKNNISSIEGLRELVRLRVLDLSYNRILRVGHGLASCSSLKELYLAGNKISEVEGLHRLLKLNILDLRFNKISTAKCLGQLAANYGSLQSVNLEGNPAQRNVGDEHLKKYLHSVLPLLVYYNKQHIRASSSLKEVAERPARQALTTHQSDRGPRSEHKLVRKGIHNAATSKGSPSSNHGLRGHSLRSPKASKDHHGHLPPAGTKGTHHRNHFLDMSSKWLNLRPGAGTSMRRSWSEGNLGVS